MIAVGAPACRRPRPARRLAADAAPREVVFVQQLARSSTGKLLKRDRVGGSF